MTTTSRIQSPSSYSLDTGWRAERERLASLTRLYDDTTLWLCQQLNIGPGAHCLELGAGTGTVAEALAERVMPGGLVIDTDTDIRFLEPLADRALRVEQPTSQRVCRMGRSTSSTPGCCSSISRSGLRWTPSSAGACLARSPRPVSSTSAPTLKPGRSTPTPDAGSRNGNSSSPNSVPPCSPKGSSNRPISTPSRASAMTAPQSSSHLSW